MKKPLISVIIPTLNEAESLAKLLSDLKQQTYKNFEVIVVDEHSTDKTVKVAKESNAKILFSNKGNLSFARNLGIKKSKGTIIVNLDADFRINKEFLKGVLESFKDKKVQGIKVREMLEQDSLLERIDYLRSFYRYGDYTLSVRIFRKGITYDEDIKHFGEDMHIEKKIKDKIHYSDKSLIKHHRFHSFRDVIKSWKVYCSSFTFYKKYEGPMSILKGFIPLTFPIITPFITIHRLIKFKDPRALLIPLYDLIRAFSFIAGILDYYF